MIKKESMKILESSVIFSQGFDNNEEKEVAKLVKTSEPSTNSKISQIKIEEKADWIYIKGKINESEFSINQSAYVSDISFLIKFFEEIIELKEEIVLVLDYEGSNPILYSEPVYKNNVRILFAHDYDLFLKDNIDDYKISDYKIVFDIIINKKELIKNFYDVLYTFTMHYDIKKAQKRHYGDVFNIGNGKKYLNRIKTYLESQPD